MTKHKIQIFETWVVPFEYEDGSLVEQEAEYSSEDPYFMCRCGERLHGEDEAIEHMEENKDV